MLASDLEHWEDVQLLLLRRQASNADAFARLDGERDSLLEAYEHHVRDVPERERLRLIMDLRKMTFRYVFNPWLRLYIPGLRKFLSDFKDILVKVVAALLFAALAGTAHQFFAARIDPAFHGWLRQYFALVAFILAYKVLERPLEGAIERLVRAIRRWDLLAEARGIWLDGKRVEFWKAEVSRLRTSLVRELGKDHP